MSEDELRQALDQLLKQWYSMRLPPDAKEHVSIRHLGIDEAAGMIKAQYDRVREHLLRSNGLDHHKLAAVFCCTLIDKDHFPKLLVFARGTVHDSQKWRDHCRRDLAIETFFSLLSCPIAALSKEVRNPLEYLLEYEAPKPLALAMMGYLFEKAYCDSHAESNDV